MIRLDQHQEALGPAPTFRLDVPLHNLLMKSKPDPKVLLPAPGEGQTLPDPIFPQYPELLRDDFVDEPLGPNDQRHWSWPLIMRGLRGWCFPYVKSRVLPGDFHPIIAYLFTEWKCNLDCHYCWAFDNSVKGMTEDVARRSIDWLH